MNLVEIVHPPTAENAVIQLHARDNIAIARVPLPAGHLFRVQGVEIEAPQAVPQGHQVAVRRIEAGEIVMRYGQAIGRALAPIAPGEHVHGHNLAFEERVFDYEFPEGEVAFPEVPADAPTFLGYPREDGRVGTRNYIAVVAASNCAAHTAQLIARAFEGRELPPNVDGVVALPHGEGCGMSGGEDLEQLRRTLGGVLVHPNVAGAVILGLGCEVNQIDHYLGEGGPRSDRLQGFTLQGSGGTRATVEAVIPVVERMMERAAAEKRQVVPASKLVLGLECGGSDSFSGVTANPALGFCSDLLASMGGTPILAETTEILGAQHLLVRRSRNRAVAEKLRGMIAWYKEYVGRFGGSFDENPSPGNKAGGLTNIVEKSLGAVAKGGTSTLMDVLGFAERVQTPGFVFMNTPGYDPPSLTGMAAGGANVLAFTTGRGSATGFPTVPVMKIVTNTATYRQMTEDMDVNAGTIADGTATVEEVGREIFDLMLRVASGERTCSERLGHAEFVPWRIGPVL